MFLPPKQQTGTQELRDAAARKYARRRGVSWVWIGLGVALVAGILFWVLK